MKKLFGSEDQGYHRFGDEGDGPGYHRIGDTDGGAPIRGGGIDGT